MRAEERAALMQYARAGNEALMCGTGDTCGEGEATGGMNARYMSISAK
jgi:hypothetical protein